MFPYDKGREEGFRRIADRVAAYRAWEGRQGPSVGFALGSGAARGLAHIGVVKTLFEAGIKVDLIAGCSIGAVVGGMVACGIPCQEIAGIASTISRFTVLSYTDLTLPIKGFLSGQRIQSFLSDQCGDRTMEDAPIPFVAAATDILTGEEVVLDSGPMIDGMREHVDPYGLRPAQSLREASGRRRACQSRPCRLLEAGRAGRVHRSQRGAQSGPEVHRRTQGD